MTLTTNAPQRLTKGQLFRAAVKSREWKGPASLAILFQIIHFALALAQLMLALYLFYTLIAFAKWEEPCYKYHAKGSAHTEMMRPPMTVVYLDQETLEAERGGSFRRGMPLPALICFSILLPLSTLGFSLGLIIKSIWRQVSPRLLDGLLAGCMQILLIATTFSGEIFMPVDYRRPVGKLPICVVGDERRRKIMRARGERINTMFAWEMVMGAEAGLILIYLTLTFLGVVRKMKTNETADIELVAQRRVDILLAETLPQGDQTAASPPTTTAHDYDSPPSPKAEDAEVGTDEAVNTPLPPPVPAQHREDEESDLGNRRAGAKSVSGGSDGDWCEVGDVSAEGEGQKSRV